MSLIVTGVYPDLENEKYHGAKSTVSRSALMDFDVNPFNYWSKHINPNRPAREITPALLMGGAFHCLVLEPHKFEKEYVLMPEPVLLKDVGREQYELYKETVKNVETTTKKVIPYAMYVTLNEMFEVFQKNSPAFGLIKDARIENSFFWKDRESGLDLKCRPDALHSNMIVDIKTCADASPRAFQHEMVKYGYHIQGAMIRDAVEELENNRIDSVINIAIEKKYPYAMGIYIIDEFALDEGRIKYKRLANELSKSLRENVWIDYGVQQIGLPKWAI